MSKILLHLGFDYFSKGRTGVGAYQSHIIWGLECDYDIVVPAGVDIKTMLPKNAHPVILSSKKKKVMALCKKIFPIDLFFKGYDLVIIGGLCFKSSKKTKQYVIVHDLMSFTEPENYTFIQRFYHRVASKSYKYADKLIAVSQSTKQALHDLFKIEFNKIIVVPNITDFYIEHKERNDFLFIGDMRKTKNLSSLIIGFAEYKKKNLGNEKLIIAGSKKYEYDFLQQLTTSLGLTEQIVFPGYVTEEQKIDYFSNAKACVFLSDNEGFGIPLLEFAVNGIPVLCSDIPVFHEVLDENYAIYVDNKNPESISDGFERISNLNISKDACLKLKEKYSVAMFNEKINNLIKEIETIK